MTVVMPVYNCRASLGRALESVYEQSLGRSAGAGAIEIIAVDDGSTDGSGEELDRMAAARLGLTVVHQPNSGGPGAPRNTGIDRASGEYVFFLDADDHLAPEALERMCAMADANGTDVVVGQYVGVGRQAPVFPRDLPRTTVAETPLLYNTLSPLKLFRRSLLERLGLRFVENLFSHEDMLFTAQAYFGADGISVVASYDCYYWIDREDGTSSLQQGGAPAEQYFPAISEVMSFLAGRVEPGPLRDRLMLRHFRHEIATRFGARYRELPEEEQALTRVGARRLVDAWYTPGVETGLWPRSRLVMHCLRYRLDDVLAEIVATDPDGPPPPTVVEKDKAFQAFPRFRDPATALPDHLYDITDRIGTENRLTEVSWTPSGLRVIGRAALSGVTERQETTLLLRRRGEPSAERRLPARALPPDRFRADIDLVADETLDDGAWDLYVEMRVQELTVVRQLRPADDLEPPERRLVRGGRAAVPARRGQGLELRVTAAQPGVVMTLESADWAADGVLRITGHVPSALPSGHPVEASAELLRRQDGTVVPAKARASCVPEALNLTAEFDLRGCDPGRWTPWVRFTVDGVTIRVRPPAPPSPPRPGPAGRLRQATPYRTERGGLSVKITPARAAQAARRFARRLRG
ncbi:glycosyltransferase family 2 protein [Actinomadura miaoliensis]